MDDREVTSIQPALGQTVRITNGRGLSGVYRVRFSGTGMVEFLLAPGGQFSIISESGVYDVDYDDLAAIGVQGVADANIDPGVVDQIDGEKG